ncbi:hypothetical protein [Sutterella sp.]|uniref:hypothetical protein n=1 Tax=Sutterella sp. TaxID=1981025 RepID=UPI0026DF4C64|nr:hypothetical protein [Sutterella sp.]MDO5531772.1 hypothetical protein [Sutterella sp.]
MANSENQQNQSTAAPETNDQKTEVSSERKCSVQCLKKTPLWQKGFLAVVILPTLLVFLYLMFWASPMYISETKFAVRSAAEQSSPLDLVGQIFRTSSSTTQDAQIVREYIESPDAFDTLNASLKLTEHFSASTHDLISRLAGNPTLDERTRFWNCVAKPVVNPDTGIVSFQVRAYTPEMATAISDGVLKASEKLVNDMNERAREDAMKLAEEEVNRAKDRLTRAQQALKDFRGKYQDIDPKSTATGLQSVLIELEGQRAALKAQISEAESYMAKNAPALQTLKTRLSALEAQIASEKNRLAGNTAQTGTETFNSLASEYESLMIEGEFAQKQLVSAMTAMETARVTMLSQSKYLVTISAPTSPDESLYPNPLLMTLCVFIGLIVCYGLGTLIVASIREHAGF